jgi:class 3 adenylate cyclase/tetratricopeptide (TPR) repeat protein
VICPTCGADNPLGARFCNACGAALPAEPAREVRKVVTVLFCDVTGSTAMGERLDPEQLRGVMAEYFAVARAAIERHGGTVEKFIGDAVMAVFGVPTVREDDALRAVRAALELCEASSLDLRIGVNTGEVVTGSGETLVTGDAVNVAARLEQSAGPGEVLLGDATYQLVRHAVDAELMPPIEAKGKSESVTAYRLRSLTGGAGYERRTDAPLVGREREQRLLGDAWDRCRSENACVQFTVLGSAGVGKSRLTAEFLSGLDARVISGRCLSYGEGITYWPVVEVVKQLLGDEPPPNAAIASLLGEGDAAAEDIAFAVRRLLETSARSRPLVVVFDDLQWAEPTFLDLIEHLTDWSRDAPLLVLCLARPELLDVRSGWGGGKLNATTDLLEPLTEGETDELIERLLGSAELESGLQERIRKAAGGNPLFVEQMLAMAQDSPGADVSVPPTIQALLAARLDQLPSGERLALERGAVEGQVFHRGAVEALAPDEPSIPARLMGLVRKELLRPTTATLPEDDAFRFRHLLIRDAAYDALPKMTRAELHERFALWLEEHGGLVELDEILGYHLEQAARYRAELGEELGDLASRAGAHLTDAGRRAVFRGDVAAGRRLLSRAVELLDGLPQRSAALPWLGVALYSGGEFAESDRVLTEAVDTADGDDAAIAFFARSLGRGHNPVEGDTLASLEEEVRARLAGLEHASPLAYAEGYHALTRLLFWQGRTEEQLAAAKLARSFAREGGVSVLEGMCAGMIGTALIYGESSWNEYEAFARSLLDERDRLGRIVDNALSGLAVASSAQGRADESAQLFADYEAALIERGDEYAARTQGQNRGYGMYLVGEVEAAERIYRESWDALGEVGERGFRSTLGALLALALIDLDRRGEAEGILAEVEAITTDDDWLTVACADLVRARLATLDGRHDDAVEAARRAAGLGDEGYFLLRPWFTTELGRALAAAGRDGEARDVLAEAIRVAHVKGSLVYVRRAEDVLGTLG